MTFLEKARCFIRHPIKVSKIWMNGMVLVKASEIDQKHWGYYWEADIYISDVKNVKRKKKWEIWKRN
jgi:hypothetical protein